MLKIAKKIKSIVKHVSFSKQQQRANKIAQKIISIVVSASLIITMVPNIRVFAEGSETFVSSAYPNHWGRSDLRAYLNNGLADVAYDGGISNKNYGIDSTAGTYESDNTSGGFANQFSKKEYDLVQPFTYNTNVLDASFIATTVYQTTDKFWLPSGNQTSNQIISWGREDISANAQYTVSTTNDKGRIIPASYWAYTRGGGSDQNSPMRSVSIHSADNYYILRANSNSSTIEDMRVDQTVDLAAAFKIDLSLVNFASSASAASIISEGGAQKIEIKGSSEFGTKTSNPLPDYGMYLKTSSRDSFEPNSLTISGTDLIVDYTDGVDGQYVVVHAFKSDDLSNDTASYVAAARLNSSSTSVTIDITNWKDSLGSTITSLDGYTIKVWMEDDSGSLSAATDPITFVGDNGTISKGTTGAIENNRVFAMKSDLKTSWGVLSDASDLIGSNATNQKIYFGVDSSGAPLEFWIAGRETAANNGEISDSGEVMTLYQAKTVDKRQHNSVWDTDYVGNDPVTLQLQDGISGTTYPESAITFRQGSTDLNKSLLVFQYRIPGTTVWTNGMPTTPGDYEIRCYAPATSNYDLTYSAVVNFTLIGNTPSASDFTFNPPDELTYDGRPKFATVTGGPGTGAITVKYYKDDGVTPAVGGVATNAPTNVGTYKVKIDVGVGSSYLPVNDLTDPSWTFTITKATPTYSVGSLEAKEVFYGVKLGSVYSSDQLKTQLGSPQRGSENIPGTWSWADGENYPTGSVGLKNFRAWFTPDPSIKDNYDWSRVTGWDSTNEVISVDVPVKVIPLPIGSSASIDLSSPSFIYNGREQKPTVTITDGMGHTLAETEYDIIWPSDLTNAGDKRFVINFKGNYDGQIDAQYTITKATITPSITTVSNKEYDGTTDANATIAFAGLKNGETLVKNMDYTISANFDNANAGNSKTVTAIITLKTTDKANNYTLASNTASATANIAKKAITVTADNKSKIEGEKDPELTYTVSSLTPLVSGETLFGILSRLRGETSGTYSIMQGSLTNENNLNYNITFKTGTFTIIGKSVSEKPTEPEKPIEPEKPTEPERPIEPERPTEPEKPIESEKPTEPERPTESEKPTVSEKPIESEKSTESDRSTESETAKKSDSKQESLALETGDELIYLVFGLIFIMMLSLILIIKLKNKQEEFDK